MLDLRANNAKMPRSNLISSSHRAQLDVISYHKACVSFFFFKIYAQLVLDVCIGFAEAGLRMVVSLKLDRIGPNVQVRLARFNSASEKSFFFFCFFLFHEKI